MMPFSMVLIFFITWANRSSLTAQKTTLRQKLGKYFIFWRDTESERNGIKIIHLK